MTLAALFLGAATSAAGEEPEPLPGARVERIASLRRWDVVLPGRLVSYTLLRRADGGRDVAFLVAPASAKKVAQARRDPDLPPPCPEPPGRPAPRSIFRMRPGEVELVPWRADLPAELVRLGSADVDGDGADELLASGPSGLYRIDRTSLDRLAAGVGLRRHGVRPAGDGDERPLWTVDWGTLRVFDDPGDGDGWREIATVDLPRHGSFNGTELEVRPSRIDLVGRRGDGTALFATEPQPGGGRRLHTLLIEIAPGGEVTRTDAWSGLPELEAVMEHSFLMLDGEPFLMVTSRPSDRLSLLGEKRLRIFPIERDRSRLGIAPRFAVESRMNLWQDAQVWLADVNGDGRKDLVVGYWKGLITDRVVLDAYLREAEGSFRRAPRTTAFDVRDAHTDYLLYGNDLDGDGNPDLLLAAADGMRLHAGLESRRGNKLVDTSARVIPAGAWTGERDHEIVLQAGGTAWETPLLPVRPRLADLDGDARPEIVLARTATDVGAFRVIWLDR